MANLNILQEQWMFGWSHWCHQATPLSSFGVQSVSGCVFSPDGNSLVIIVSYSACKTVHKLLQLQFSMLAACFTGS
jgi:hypothetical protein